MVFIGRLSNKDQFLVDLRNLLPLAQMGSENRMVFIGQGFTALPAWAMGTMGDEVRAVVDGLHAVRGNCCGTFENISAWIHAWDGSVHNSLFLYLRTIWHARHVTRARGIFNLRGVFDFVIFLSSEKSPFRK